MTDIYDDAPWTDMDVEDLTAALQSGTASWKQETLRVCENVQLSNA